MSLHRCPSCRNLVEKESETCPICGRTFVQAIAIRAMPWVVLAIVAAWSLHHFHFVR
jgi:hypothetical protein